MRISCSRGLLSNSSLHRTGDNKSIVQSDSGGRHRRDSTTFFIGPYVDKYEARKETINTNIISTTFVNTRQIQQNPPSFWLSHLKLLLPSVSKSLLKVKTYCMSKQTCKKNHPSGIFGNVRIWRNCC
jgi:hypothetical protein